MGRDDHDQPVAGDDDHERFKRPRELQRDTIGSVCRKSSACVCVCAGKRGWIPAILAALQHGPRTRTGPVARVHTHIVLGVRENERANGERTRGFQFAGNGRGGWAGRGRHRGQIAVHKEYIFLTPLIPSPSPTHTHIEYKHNSVS